VVSPEVRLAVFLNELPQQPLLDLSGALMHKKECFQLPQDVQAYDVGGRPQQCLNQTHGPTTVLGSLVNS
jgi:hypothetical protein